MICAKLRMPSFERLAKDKASPHIHQEMLLNTAEVTSGKRTKISECLEDLRYGVTALRRALPMR